MLRAEEIKEEEHTGKANEGRNPAKERQKLSRSGARRDVDTQHMSIAWAWSLM